MAFLYPQLSEIFSSVGTPLSPLLSHMLMLFMGYCLSLYGLYGVIKYSKTFSKNWHLLAAAFALMAFMPLGDIMEHLEFWPGMEYWHHFHLFAGVVAFYFLHSFIKNVDAAKPESALKTAVTLLVLSAVAVAFVYFEETYGDDNAWVLNIIYAVCIVVAAIYVKFLWDIWHNARNAESAFSLKTFFTSMLPIISISLFVLTFTGILAEAMNDTVPDVETNQIFLFLVALQNPLFMILAMTLTCFAYMGAKVQAFYAPIEKFIAGKGRTKKGRVAVR